MFPSRSNLQVCTEEELAEEITEILSFKIEDCLRMNTTLQQSVMSFFNLHLKRTVRLLAQLNAQKDTGKNEL